MTDRKMGQGRRGMFVHGMKRMRSVSVAVVFATMLPFIANAQVGIGLRTGLSLTTMTNVKSEPLKLVAKPGASAAVFGEFRLVGSEALSVYLTTEVGFEQKGIRYTNSSGDWVSFGIDYVQLPITTKLAIGKRRLRGTFEVGVFGATPINAFTNNSSGDRDRATLKNLTRYDIGAVIGGGIEFRLGPGALFTSIRLVQGFIDPYGDKVDDYQMNVSPSIALGYVFRLGKDNAAASAQDQVSAEQEQIARSVSEPEPIRVEPEPEPQPEQTNAQELRVVSGPGNAQAAAATSDFGALIQLNKRFDAIADPDVDATTRTVNATEVLNQFIGPDAVVILLKSGVVVDYYSISEFLRYIELNHFKYKITDREVDASGLMSQIRVHRID